VWAYSQALRRLSVAKGFDFIAFSRIRDFVNVNVPDELDEMTYVANASYLRLALLNEFSRPNFDASLRISEDEDTCLTYRGYIKFLSTDLQYVYPIGEDRSKKKYKKGVEYIAKKMLARGDVSTPNP
jgi:pyoverdine/dityrosine biosynthesis protein Dit1